MQTLAALLTAGADASALGECTGPFGLVRCDHPLYAAVAGGHREAIKLLVRHGADPMNDRGVYLLSPGPTAIEAALVRPVQELCTWHGGGGGTCYTRCVPVPVCVCAFTLLLPDGATTTIRSTAKKI